MKDFILLYTADENLATTVESALSDYSVIRCASISQAKVLCAKHKIRIALLVDGQVATDGLAPLAVLQQEIPGLHGVLLAGSIDNYTLNNALESGFSGLLEMPINPGQATGTIRRVMNQAQLLAENTRLRTLLPLYSLGEQFIGCTYEQEVLDGLLESVAKLTDSKNISVLLFDSEKEYLYIAAAIGMDTHLVESVRVRPGEKIAGWVFESGKSVLLNKEEQDQSIFAPFLKRPEVVSAISCPIRIRDEILGVLNISRTHTDSRFSAADMEMVSVVCTQAAMALDNVRALKRIKEMTRVRTLLEQYVSPEVAEVLIQKDSDLLQVGNVQEVTILFADLRNFTGLVQELDLEQIRTFLNAFFKIFTETIYIKQGIVDKFMGDAVLAVFGAPLVNEHSAAAAVEAAVMIRKRFAALRADWKAKGEMFNGLDLGMGITHGYVFHGNVGSRRRLDYTVIGQDVNIAQRLAAESTMCRIFMTQAVQSRLPEGYRLDRHDGVSLRGLDGRFVIYSVADENFTCAD